ncbi:MAG: hypothetical protein ACREPC_06485 [Stenotrophomonas sp.]|uniref:hypothetical protein n=1 Tax=Stenotrophomonas sp. TaxID=69392 RepID=UPI003D6C9249
MARDLLSGPGTMSASGDGRPARELTFTMPGGGTETLRFQPDTPEAATAAAARVAAFERRWNDLADTIRTTPRDRLAAPVADQQALAREGKRIELTECLEPGRVFWSAALDAEVAFVGSLIAGRRDSQSLAAEVSRNFENWKKVEVACR